MSVETIKDLVEKVSCELVLADVNQIETLSVLLPVLKRIHTECVSNALRDAGKIVLRARNLIDEIVSQKAGNPEEKLGQLEKAISDLSVLLSASPSENEPGEPAEKGEREANLQERFVQLEHQLEIFSQLLGTFCPGEIPDLGAMIDNTNRLVEISKSIEPSTFHDISLACKDYAENLTLENMQQTKPVEEALLLLKSILSHLKHGEAFVFDYSEVLELLQCQFREEKTKPVRTGTGPEEFPEGDETEGGPEKISDDDMEILMDFISEARDNLDTIEVNLVDLEQEPENKEIINDIFRPFHTIKGVSGFLSLTKINKLSHATENLLDGARSGDFVINQTATDTILESVDALKHLIGRLDEGIQSGVKLPDTDIDVDTLRKKLESLQKALTDGEPEPLGRILVKQKAVDPKSIERALDIQKENPLKKIGEILIEEHAADAGQVESALKEQGLTRQRIDTQVKVSTQKLDDLVDYAGELVIAQSMLRQKTSHDPSLSQSVTQLGQIVTNMQNIAMSMRMIPIKATFMKMIRLVRDLSRKSGKDVSLSMSGEDTEIDRNVVDALYEPMVHMIRNSVDHGIEPGEIRKENQKSVKGQINLRAYHKGGHIIIEIEDDGGGLDKDRILEKARMSGLVADGDALTDSQIFNLIMAPGFSTAKTITDVSGRGVGMDVVKAAIEKFRGHLNIDSQKGVGTKFTISLPLTLAIIDGMLVRVNQEKYVIPTISIQKAFKPAPDEYFTVEGKGEMVKDRGALVPLIRLDRLYHGGSRERPVTECLVVVVESKDEKRAVLIDELLGKDEYVIKSLGGALEDVAGIAGGAILADGKVGLILDIHGVFSLASA